MKTMPSLVGLGLGFMIAANSACAEDRAGTVEETPADIIAAQIRKQGYSCDTSISAERDKALSKPDEAVWILKCDTASYRVRLVPDMAAIVEKLE